MTPTVCDNLFTEALILDADPAVNRVVLEQLARRGGRGTVAGTLRSANAVLGKKPWRLVFLYQKFETLCDTSESQKLLSRLRLDYPEVPIIRLGDEDSSREAMEALRAGCTDYLSKPIREEELDRVLTRYLPTPPSKVMASVCEDRNRCVIIGGSKALGETIRNARRAAPTAAPVLICGESGTGKELLAQLIHATSRRAQGPFVRVNCAALNESLLESELFGHEKGAFTGAMFCHRGRFERAHGGTLLLDEITETPPAFQAKLLRILEQMSFERVGGTENIEVNVRVLSTTNGDILRLVREGRFRADLYYRLAGIRLTVPPLRNRREDLPELIWYFISQYSAEAGRQIEGIDRETLQIFEEYHWPGNIRQLRNVIRTALILGGGPLLSIMGIPALLRELREDRPEPAAEGEDLAGLPLAELERRAILATLSRTEGNQARAARVLGISDRTLRDKVRRYQQESLQTIG